MTYGVGLVLLGVSLSIKHDLILFPVWLALKRGGVAHRIACIVIPYGVFWLSLHCWHNAAIQQHVLGYRSENNGIFWVTFAPGAITSLVPFLQLMVGAMLAVGLVTYRQPVRESFFLYLCCLVLFSSASANQYLVIPLAALAAQWNRWALAYTVVGTIYLCSSPEGLFLPQFQYYWPATGDAAVPWWRLLLLCLMLNRVSLRCAQSDRVNGR